MPAPDFYLPPPRDAVGTYLRIVSVSDVYELDNYPYIGSAIDRLKRTSEGAVVVSSLNGDFLSPCIFTSLDGGKAIVDVLNTVGIDYLCLGNHEFDVGIDVLSSRLEALESRCLNGNIPHLPAVDRAGRPLPAYEVVAVGDRRVAFAGFCTSNPECFRPGAVPEIVPIPEAIEAIWAQCEAEGKADLLIALTHQNIAADRALAMEISSNPALKNRVPVLLGGHEHCIFIEESGKSLIVKPGMNATHAVVTDVWWTQTGCVRSATHLLSASHFRAAPHVRVAVEQKQHLLNAIADVELFAVQEAMSSKRTRFRPEQLPAKICAYIKASLRGVDLVLLQGGTFRGARDYEVGTSFTYNHLLEEMPYETEIAVIDIPGWVLQAAIAHTRGTPDAENPGYLHADPGTHIEAYPGLEITRINGAAFDPEKMYEVGIYQALLAGMDEIAPLVDYVRELGGPPAVDRCIPAKNLILEACMKDIWRRLVDYDRWDTDGDRHISQAELEAALQETFARLDLDGDGQISKAELSAALTEKFGITSSNLIAMAFDALDLDRNGLVSTQELAALAV